MFMSSPSVQQVSSVETNGSDEGATIYRLGEDVELTEDQEEIDVSYLRVGKLENLEKCRSWLLRIVIQHHSDPRPEVEVVEADRQ